MADMMPKLTPSALDRVAAKRMAGGDVGYLDWGETEEIVEEAWRDSFLATVALLKEPSDELCTDLAKITNTTWGDCEAILRALADKMEGK